MFSFSLVIINCKKGRLFFRNILHTIITLHKRSTLELQVVSSFSLRGLYMRSMHALTC